MIHCSKRLADVELLDGLEYYDLMVEYLELLGSEHEWEVEGIRVARNG